MEKFGHMPKEVIRDYLHEREDVSAETRAELAKRRKIGIMAVPVDAASASCSNRAQVAQYYQEHFKKNQALELVNTPETNFNGYNNWNPKNSYPVRRTDTQ